MSRTIKVLFLEGLLKGGFFLSGIMLYTADKTAFGHFTFLNSIFTLAYNVISFGIPFLYARELHRQRSFPLSGLRSLFVCVLCAGIMALALFTSYWLYITAALASLVSDTVYSKYRISADRRIYIALLTSGFVMFGFNVLSGIYLEVDYRYTGTIASFAFLAFFLVGTRPLTGSLAKTRQAQNWRLLADGFGFSLTHGLFWIRNGLDKVLLFPLLGSEDYAHYGMFFFVVSAGQTVWTSLMRIGQSQIFDFVVNSYDVFFKRYVYTVAISMTMLVLCYVFRLNYGFVIAVGAIAHFTNQMFLNLINYHFPVFVYTASNLLVALIYLSWLHLATLSVSLLAFLFALSNLLLALCYIVLSYSKYGKTNVQTQSVA